MNAGVTDSAERFDARSSERLVLIDGRAYPRGDCIFTAEDFTACRKQVDIRPAFRLYQRDEASTR